MLNVNVGLLGHVDSGKTSLAKALSQTASTAAFDKSPQSQSRGITLDLGFSSCLVDQDTPICGPLLKAADVEKVQFTFVDCPGHSSLIRTIIGGAQIIDVMVLVVDAVKGVQAQTAECLVLGEVLAKPLVVAVNKIDSVPAASAAEREAAVQKLVHKLRNTFRKTRWPDVPIVCVAADPKEGAPQNVSAVLPHVLSLVSLPALKRQSEDLTQLARELFRLQVDHCFAVKGQGTVFTGTVMSGVVRVGDTIFLPEQQVTKKVKGLQMFRRPVEQARKGERVGLCVTQFDPSQMERGILCGLSTTNAEGKDRSAVSMQSSSVWVAEAHRVRYHALPCDNHTKFHITIGHTTVMGTMRYFSRPATAATTPAVPTPFDYTTEGIYMDALEDEAFTQYASTTTTTDGVAPPGTPLPLQTEKTLYFAILLLEAPVFATVGSAFVAMRLDVEKENFCRIALAGGLVAPLLSEVKCVSGNETNLGGGGGGGTTELPNWRSLNVVRFKDRCLAVDRVVDGRTCIAEGVVHDMAQEGGGGGSAEQNTTKKDKDVMLAEVQKFIGLAVIFCPDKTEGVEGTPETDEGCVKGTVDSAFGKSGKVRLAFEKPIFAPDGASTKKKAKGAPEKELAAPTSCFVSPGRIVLRLKKYPLASHSSLKQ